MEHSFRILASINQCISVFNESRSTVKDTDAHSSTWSSLLSGTLPGAWHPSTPFRPTRSRYRYKERGRGSCGASFQQISLCYIVNGHVERHVWDSLDVIQCEASVETSTNPLLQHTREVCETLKTRERPSLWKSAPTRLDGAQYLADNLRNRVEGCSIKPLFSFVHLHPPPNDIKGVNDIDCHEARESAARDTCLQDEGGMRGRQREGGKGEDCDSRQGQESSASSNEGSRRCSMSRFLSSDKRDKKMPMLHRD